MANIVEKVGLTSTDKFLVDILGPDQRDSLVSWSQIYFAVNVKGAPEKTVIAKTNDLNKFLSFCDRVLKTDHVDAWTPAISREFQRELKDTISEKTGRGYAPSTVNRIVATVKHFGRWLNQQRPLLAGDPFASVKDIELDDPDWNGLSDRDILRLKSACEVRLKSCTRKDQNPYLETAVFYVLLHTGLREAELCALNFDQYHHRGFHNVKRKGNRVQSKIHVPKAAKERLDEYLDQSYSENQALFVSRYGNRITPEGVRFICERLAKQASVHLKERIKLTPHMLRHTFLKKAADKKGVHFAQEVSGNKSTRVIFRYTKPSPKEIEEATESLFD